MAQTPLPNAFLTVPLAHRGYHNAGRNHPENSLSAFQAAVDAGYGIELDVQLSADGQAIVFHDDALDRMTDRSGAIFNHTAAELCAIGLRDSKDFIPTLPQVLKLVGGKVPLLIEIKERLDTMQDTSGRLEGAVAQALGHYPRSAAVMSFNPHCLMHMARLAPHIPRGITTEDYDPKQCFPISPEVCAKLREIPDYDRTEGSFISHKASDLSRPRVAELKAQGAVILCWTIRSAKEEAKARLIADNITFEGYAAAIGA